MTGGKNSPKCELRSPKSKAHRAAVSASLLLWVAAAGLTIAGCGTTTYKNIALPVVTVSPASTSVAAGGSIQFTVSVVSSTSTTISWYVNNVQGGSATLGTVTSAGLYVAPPVVPTPSTVTVKAVSSAESNPSGSAIVTITAGATGLSAVAPGDSSTPVSTTVQYTATLEGDASPAVNWSVSGVAGGNSTVGSITGAGLYTAPASIPSPPTVVITATNAVDSTQVASTTLTLTTSNAAPLFVNLGPEGNTGSQATTNYNGLYTNVTVCLPGTNMCQTIPNILVDTSSVGLRVLNSQLTTVPASELTTIRDSQNNQVQECVQFPDTSYAWGPALYADVVVAGEKASHIPIQVIGDTTYNVPASSCLSLGNGPSLSTVAALGANGILGVGSGVQDCGLDCAGGQTFSGYPYYVCPNNNCKVVAVPVAQQVANPVAYFAQDNNGVEIALPALPAAGAPQLPYTNADGSIFYPAGLLIFGVGTQSNNALGGATVYAKDGNGNFANVTFNGIPYPSGGLIDTRSNALYISNPATLGITACTDSPYYCPASPAVIPLTVEDVNGTSGEVTLDVANADLLLASNPDFSAFNDLARPGGTAYPADFFDLGLPFFFGRNVFVGIAGTTAPGGVSAPNGYFAF